MKTTKKILCFIDELGSGGAERQLVGLASMLKKHGYEVDVFCYHPIYFYEALLQESNVNLIKVLKHPKNGLQKLWRSFRIMKKGKYDFIISYSPGSSFAALLCKILLIKTKLIVSDRNMTPHITLRQNIKFNLYRLADYIVPNSYTQTEILKEHYPFMEPKLHTITNFVDFTKFSPIATPIKREEDILRIIVVARHAEDKNIPNFIKAVKLAKDNKIKFIVDWYGNYNTPLGRDNLEMVKEYHIEDILHFLPPVNNIYEYYKQAHALCLPSVREGFSNVIGEGMCCGLPIICGNISDNIRMVEDKVNGYLFDPTDPQDIARVIKELSESKLELLESMRKNNIQKAKTLLSPYTFISNYIKLIEA